MTDLPTKIAKTEVFQAPFDIRYLKPYNQAEHLGAQDYAVYSKTGGWHLARDIALKKAELISAPANCKVLSVTNYKGAQHIRLQFSIYDKGEFKPVILRIAHLENVTVKAGDILLQGQIIGSAQFLKDVRQTMVCIQMTVDGKYKDFKKHLGLRTHYEEEKPKLAKY